jgi:uncharacterized damage-inducible protein DinB
MENEVEMIRDWFSYIAEARRGYLETLAKLPPAELTRDRGASFPSILDIFAHSQGALYFWMKDAATFPFPPQEGSSDAAAASIAELRKDEAYIQTQIKRVMAELTEAGLSRTIARKAGRGSDHDCDVPVRDALWHLVEEELQHRGEINALLWQIDIEAPVFDWVEWAHTKGRIKDPPSK